MFNVKGACNSGLFCCVKDFTRTWKHWPGHGIFDRVEVKKGNEIVIGAYCPGIDEILIFHAGGTVARIGYITESDIKQYFVSIHWRPQNENDSRNKNS